jgi:hypothetical protein
MARDMIRGRRDGVSREQQRAAARKHATSTQGEGTLRACSIHKSMSSRAGRKRYLHTRAASGQADSEARRRDDSPARWTGAIPSRRQSSAVAQRSAQSTSGASAWAAAAAARGGFWAREPLTSAGQSSALLEGGNHGRASRGGGRRCARRW